VFAFQVKGLDIVVGGHTNTFLWSGPMEDAKVGGVPAGQYPTEVLQPSGRRVLVVQTNGYGLYLGHLRITFNQVCCRNYKSALRPTGSFMFLKIEIKPV
jgi:2',3'-cyclic-nucleotide 2'-phosphodiesterase (5'-nucleotidase family)